MHTEASDPALPAAAWQLVCLCAAWCRLCESYRADFEEVGRRLQADWRGLSLRWIDIEDESDLCADLDIETFPTVMLCSVRAVHFAGTLTPHAATLERVIRAALVAAPVAIDPGFTALAGRLRSGRSA